jgi:hypothetical protein
MKLLDASQAAEMLVSSVSEAWKSGECFGLLPVRKQVLGRTCGEWLAECVPNGEACIFPTGTATPCCNGICNKVTGGCEALECPGGTTGDPGVFQHGCQLILFVLYL